MNLKYPIADHLIQRGSWYDIGFAVGRSQRGMVRLNILAYAVLHKGSRQLEILPEFIRKTEKFLKSHFPAELAELHGVADGAEVDFSLILTLSFSPGLNGLVSESKPLVASPLEECSNVMFPDSEWGPLVGGTLDADPSQILLTAYPDDGIPFCAVIRPGVHTWGGMNSKGLAICGASAKPLRQENQRTDARLLGMDMILPQRVLLRSCATIEEAIVRLKEPDLLVHHNYSLMDATGRGVQIHGYDGNSLKPKIVEMPPGDGMCCGNFFPWEISEKDFGQFEGFEAKFNRYTSLREGIERNKRNYTVDGMKQILTSHEGNPSKLESVCNHATHIAMIAAPTRGKLLFATRPVCIQGFEDYSLQGPIS